ncbi:fungal-specific transcription factor domain-domain-containing protein [Naematelia encephala]|uniref:Fungal-specific transcription factor domain-domain-containing protein n=1 Tax=Naematelia encephala TaxID=71784 RepID=A0A1Y2AKL6_9TREE|nr:fungal-specific transcription factor domain-domain-containing protein [Naematelia encephala]
MSSTASRASEDTSRPKRASAACTRCRRYRQKCVMSWADGQPQVPCIGCVKAGRKIAEQCGVLPRGHSAVDRSFRRRRRPSVFEDDDTSPGTSHSPQLDNLRSKTPDPLQLVSNNTGTEESSTLNDALHNSIDSTNPVSDLLPPHSEVVDGVRAFLYNYFQLGFLPRAFFLEQVENEPASVSIFLILAILALAARFTPSLVKRYGGRKQASMELSRRAMSLIPDEMMEASLERMQALFLLGVGEFGEGNGGRSWMLTGVAIRMAATLSLHREASYALPPHPQPDEAIQSEMARRSFWLVYCHDQQIAGRSPSTTFPLSSIDALLPCEEDDFIFGQVPTLRSALPGTLAASQRIQGVTDSNRSLFATMIIGQWLWARVAEQACAPIAGAHPWEPNSEYKTLSAELDEWEKQIPSRQVFSAFTLRAMKGQNLDLGFISISMLLRLSHIVLRRAFLPCMAAAIYPDGLVSRDPGSPAGFWEKMALIMVENCISLFEQTEISLNQRTPMDGFPAVFIFGVYMVGDIAYFLYRWPKLCPIHASSAPRMLQRALTTLSLLEEAWPLATRWRVTLEQLVASTAASSSFKNTATAQRSLDEEVTIYRQPSRTSGGLPSPSELISRT